MIDMIQDFNGYLQYECPNCGRNRLRRYRSLDPRHYNQDMYVCDYCHPTNGETMDDKSYIAALENTVKKMEDTLDYIVSVRNERIEKLDIALNKIEEDLSHTMIFSDPMAYVHSVARCAVIASEALRGGDGA